MAKVFRARNLVLVGIGILAYLALQVCLLMYVGSADAVTVEYLGRGVFSESQLTREESFYPNGKDRWTFQIPPFDKNFRMHDASFKWNENRHVPPDAKTDRRDTWIGTCTLTPKSPWRQIDIFGVLGPIEYKLYGDWHTEASR